MCKVIGIEDVLSRGFRVKEFKNLSFSHGRYILLYLQVYSTHEKEY